MGFGFQKHMASHLSKIITENSHVIHSNHQLFHILESLHPDSSPAYCLHVCYAVDEALLEVSSVNHQDSATMSELKQWDSTFGSSRNKGFAHKLSYVT